MPRGSHDSLCYTTTRDWHRKDGTPCAPGSCWCKCLNCWDPFTSRCVCRACPCVRSSPVFFVSERLADLRAKTEFAARRAANGLTDPTASNQVTLGERRTAASSSRTARYGGTIGNRRDQTEAQKQAGWD